MKISLCMIVKDEESVLARCLSAAAAFADEIVLVDTGSSDGTKEVARRFTDNIYDFAWTDDFSEARNFSFSKATGDYLFWLDADDVIEPQEQKKASALRAMLESDRPDVVMCNYRTGGLVYARERFLKNVPEAKWRGHVHECIVRFGKAAHCDLTVTHLPTERDRGRRNLDIYLKWAEKERLESRDLFYFGRELYYHKLYPQAVATLEEMLAGDGWYVNKIEACKVLAACRRETGDNNAALESLFRSFLYGEPRASVLYEIGCLFKEQKNYPVAVYWFEAALACRDHTAEGDFELPACRGILPALELVVLYHLLGDREKAFEYHKKSEALAPDHPSVVFNRAYFGS